MALSRIYLWERFWCPRDKMPALTASGYSVEPSSDEFAHSNLNFQDLQHTPCIILLGEPGTGKTTWLKQEIAALETRLQPRSDVVLDVDLDKCDSFKDLEHDILDCDKFIDWKRGRHRLHLFLDSVDQLWPRSDTAFPRFLRELEKFPMDRLCLRILCRSAEWPSSLEPDLADLYETNLAPNRVQIFKLAPLSKQDVREALVGEDVPDPDGFMREIETRHLVPFAVRPKSLDYLIKAKLKTGQLPRNQAELYEKGCRLLCGEPNEKRWWKRVYASITSHLSNEELLVVASRIATLSLFCGRHRIYTGPIEPDLPAGSLSIEDIIPGTEKVADKQLAIDYRAVKETLGVQLFSSSGPQLMGWSHQTDAEFLAAQYLCRNDLDLNQIINLIQSPTDPQGKIPLPLRQVVSWLAAMRDDVLNEVVRRDPEVLLLRDLESQAEAEKHGLRERVVESLLRLLDEETLKDYNLYTDMLTRLEHPNLDGQLRSYIGDSAKNYVVRRVAVSIAEANSVSPLQDVIARVALDAKENYWVRIPAAHALTVLGDTKTKRSLLPLAMGDGGDDPDDELKGYALLAMWPDHISAEQLFALLAPPKNRSFFGAYQIDFLESGLMRGIRAEHLAPALKWVQRLRPWGGEDHVLLELADKIMVRAFENLDVPEVLEEFARTAAVRLGSYEDLFPEQRKTSDNLVFQDDRKRFLLIGKLVEIGLAENHDWQHLRACLTPLVKGEDWRLLLTRIEATTSGSARDIYARLLATVIRTPDNDQLETLFRAMKRIPALEEALQPHFEAVELDSADAKKMKEAHERRESNERKAEAHADAVRWTTERQHRWLDRIEGQICLFSNLIYNAFGAESKDAFLNPSEPSMIASYLFSIADIETQPRLIEVAHRYILETAPQAEAWMGNDTIAGFSALFLLAEKADNRLKQLRTEIWARWIPVLLAMHSNRGDDVHSKLLKLAYPKIPEDFISAAIKILDAENAKSGYPYVVSLLKKSVTIASVGR